MLPGSGINSKNDGGSDGEPIKCDPYVGIIFLYILCKETVMFLAIVLCAPLINLCLVNYRII